MFKHSAHHNVIEPEHKKSPLRSVQVLEARSDHLLFGEFILGILVDALCRRAALMAAVHEDQPRGIDVTSYLYISVISFEVAERDTRT